MSWHWLKGYAWDDLDDKFYIACMMFMYPQWANKYDDDDDL